MSPARPTIHDVAARAGMSKSLVALALSGSPKVSEKSRVRIEQAAAELGYRPNAAARSLSIRRSRTIGVLILDLHNPVFAEILDGVQTEVRQHGFSTMLVTGGENPDLELAEIETLREFQVEGLILISHRLPTDVLRSIAAEIPTVVVTRDDIVAPGMDTVSNDDVAGARLAIDHLVGLGHERIVYVSGGDNPVSHLRATGYAEAMTDHGLTEQIRIVPGGLTDATGYRAAETAVELDPTALFVANDIAAIGAIAAVENAGLRVPEDISVIGYDGISLGALRRINLTTIGQPLAELGRRAAERILHRIANSGIESNRDYLSAELRVRGTTGPAAITPS
ncbi:MAG: LacI family transcriptional regulator [Microbacteriaceae bacterium]|nr:LacI family transcriptional regulator [Microbacteriaceae bacterium]